MADDRAEREPCGGSEPSPAGLSDTHPEVERFIIERYRRMSGAERLANVWALNRCAQRLQIADIRQRYPDADEREIRLRLTSRSFPPEVMRKVFGWDPEIEGY